MNNHLTDKQIEFLLDPTSIRKRCYELTDYVKANKGLFTLHENKLNELVEFVWSVTLDNYPDLSIPYHSRWNHFNAGKIDRVKVLNQKLSQFSTDEKIKSQIDLIFVSVLLDAGAGPDWSFTDNNQRITRSEGLAVASLNSFNQGLFSSNPNNPFQADSFGLSQISISKIEEMFQVRKDNPLIGVEGRQTLLNQLSKALENHPAYFRGKEDFRPGNIINHLKLDQLKSINATDLLTIILRGLNLIWPLSLKVKDFALGDVWPHSFKKDFFDSLIPFHKLSQWLTYSLIEIFENEGIKVNSLEHLTGLPEYRNGGLLIDSGLIELKDQSLISLRHRPTDELIVEWRALTIYFLDRIYDQILKKTSKSKLEFPMAKLLEGGTWHAGRKLAFKRDKLGKPPIQLDSNGTVF